MLSFCAYPRYGGGWTVEIRHHGGGMAIMDIEPDMSLFSPPHKFVTASFKGLFVSSVWEFHNA